MTEAVGMICFSGNMSQGSVVINSNVTEHLGNLMRTGPPAPAPSFGCLLAVPGHTPRKPMVVDSGLLAVQLQGREQHHLGQRYTCGNPESLSVKYTIRSIVCEAFCHPVIWVIWVIQVIQVIRSFFQHYY